jgi:ubiquinone/menaquinone biosynthesis C-methylase UbiE
MKTSNTDLQLWNTHPLSYLDLHNENYDQFKKIFDTPAFITMLGNLKNKKILDLGCGNGDLCKALTKRGARVIGLDGAENMLKEAEKNFSGSIYILCDLLHEPIPFPSESFDIVTAKMLLDVVASVSDVSSQALRVLKSKGLYAIEIPHPMRPYIKKNKSRYIGIHAYQAETRGKIKFSDENFSYYHRSISHYINTIIELGFTLRRVQEISVDEAFVKRFPKQKDKQTFPTSWQLLFQKA